MRKATIARSSGVKHQGVRLGETTNVQKSLDPVWREKN